jgi:hypothetical protein
MFPHEDADVNHELCQLLVFLKHGKVITKSLALLDKAKTQEEQLFLRVPASQHPRWLDAAAARDVLQVAEQG